MMAKTVIEPACGRARPATTGMMALIKGAHTDKKAEASLRVVITLSGLARGKGAGRATMTHKGPRVFTDERTRNYESQLGFAAQQAMAGRAPTALPCKVDIEVRLQIPASWSKTKRSAALNGDLLPTVKPDCNNYSKSLDAFNGVVWADDKQIVHETIQKIYSERPGMTVIVETIESLGTA